VNPKKQAATPVPRRWGGCRQIFAGGTRCDACNPGIETVRGARHDRAMDHSKGFLQLVSDAQSRIQELTIDQARGRLAENPSAVLIDVREDNEWTAGHAQEAVHLGKGVFERDVEKLYPDTQRELIFYCGGGYRSALVADVAQKMGYTNVRSLIGGYKAMVSAGWPMTRG